MKWETWKVLVRQSECMCSFSYCCSVNLPFFFCFTAMLLLDNNTVTGPATAVCNNGYIQRFAADCGGDNPEVECPSDCCTTCCDDNGPECNDDGLLAQFEPIWEDSYQRRFYEFSEDLIFRPIYEAPP